MDIGPPRHRICERVLAMPDMRRPFTSRRRQKRVCMCGGACEVRVVPIQALRAKHQLEQFRMSAGKRDVSPCMGEKLIRDFHISSLCACEIMKAAESQCGQRAQQSSKVVEVMRRRCVGDTSLTSGGPQGQGVDPLALQNFFGGREQSRPQRPMMVRSHSQSLHQKDCH